MNVRIIGALLTAALLAGCGGGGAKTSSLPVAQPTATAASNPLGITSGARLTIKIPTTKPAHTQSTSSAKRVSAQAARTSSHTARTVADTKRTTKNEGCGETLSAKRSPKYITDCANGLQITVSATGATPVTQYVDTSTVNSNCSGSGDYEVCSIVVPAIAKTENISVTEVDSAPLNSGSVTPGYGTGFPSGTGVIAVGVVNSVALVSGNITDVSVSLNPVAAQFSADCGTAIFNQSDGSAIGVDSTQNRVVVRANTASTAVLQTYGANDVDDNCIGPLDFDVPEGSPPSGQQFVDVNGTPEAITATSNSAHLAIQPLQIINDDPATPAPGATFGPVATFPDTSYTYGCFDLNMRYDGTNVATATGGPVNSTLVLNNNLTATPPPFSGVSGTSYAATLTYNVVPIDAYPATLGAGGGIVTGYDYGYGDDAGLIVANSSCDGHYTITPGVATATSQPFVVSAGTGDGQACSFALEDQNSGVVTQTISVAATTPI